MTAYNTEADKEETKKYERRLGAKVNCIHHLKSTRFDSVTKHHKNKYFIAQGIALESVE